MGLRLTRFGLQGLAFYLSMVVAFFAAPYSNLFFLLLGFLTLQWLVCAWSTLRNLAGIQVEVLRFAPVPALEVGSLHFELVADRRQRFQVELRVDLEGAESLAESVDVFEGHARVSVLVPELSRGVYAVPRARLVSSFPFGFLEHSREIEVPAELLVHPQPSESGTLRTAYGVLEQILAPKPASLGDLQPAGLRDYRDGDDARAVHWRASARRGRLVIAEWDGTSEEPNKVVLDRRCSQVALESALATLTALAFRALNDRRSIAVQSQGFGGTYGPGKAPELELLRFLCAAKPLPDTELDPGQGGLGALHLPRGPRA